MLGPKKRQKGESNKWKKEGKRTVFLHSLSFAFLGKTNDARDSYMTFEKGRWGFLSVRLMGTISGKYLGDSDVCACVSRFRSMGTRTRVPPLILSPRGRIRRGGESQGGGRRRRGKGLLRKGPKEKRRKGILLLSVPRRRRRRRCGCNAPVIHTLPVPEHRRGGGGGGE